MVALLGVTTLALVAGAPWVLLAAAGGRNLTPPENVEVSIVDDTFTLTWRHHSDSAGNLTFSASYQTVYDEIKLRVRAEEGNRTSPWHELDPFIPFERAQIGPPSVRLEAEDTAIVLDVTPPGAEHGVMWHMDMASFSYTVVIWRDAEGEPKKEESRYPKIKIPGLLPETTYCLKVMASLRFQKKAGTYSPVHCVSTTVESKLPSPKNLQVTLKNQDYVLQWNYTHNNATFQAQWLHGYVKRMPGNHSGEWRPLPTCSQVRAHRCTFPHSTFPKGIYFLRVRASHGRHTSPWSPEERLDTERLALVPAPILTVRPIGGRNISLRVSVRPPRSPAALQPYLLTYEVTVWENASSAESKLVKKEVDFAVPNLKPRTVYCVKARALLEDGPRSRSSGFSDTVCEKTGPEDAPRSWLVTVICVVVLALALACAGKALQKLISYVFFPGSKPPSAINECFSEQPRENLLLPTSEEETERCFIIDNIDMLGPEETKIDKDPKTYSSQTSQDSGNYSNEDENSSSSASGELGHREGGTETASSE